MFAREKEIRCQKARAGKQEPTFKQDVCPQEATRLRLKAFWANKVCGPGEMFARQKSRKNFLKKLALTSCYYSVAFVLVHRVP